MMQYNQETDEQLIERFGRGEFAAADFLMEKYKGMVRQKARAMFLVGGETDDLIQEGMIGLYKAIRDYRVDRDTKFMTFASLCIDRMLASAVQHALRQKHQPLNSYVSLSSEENQELPGPDYSDPEQIVIANERIVQLKKQIRESLTPLENRVLSGYLDGKSYEEIGQMVGKSPKSVDNALRRVRNKIKGGIRDEMS